MNKNKLIARGAGNWDYYLSAKYEDGTQAVLYIAKPGSGAGDGVWCGVSKLRAHLKQLQSITNRKSLIPSDWEIVDADFFKSLCIE